MQGFCSVLAETLTCFLITASSDFNQSIQLDSIKTGKQILSEFPVPCWKCQLIPIGIRNQCSSPFTPHICSLSQRLLRRMGVLAMSTADSASDLVLGLVCISFSEAFVVVQRITNLSPHPCHLSFTANTNCKATRSERGDLKEAEPHKLFVWERLSFLSSNWWHAKFILQYLQ